MSEEAIAAIDDEQHVRVILKPRKAQPFFARHPWVFETAIDAVETPDGKEPAVGTVVELLSATDEFIAWGLWNSVSGIRVRLYSWERSQTFDEALIRATHRCLISCLLYTSPSPRDS